MTVDLTIVCPHCGNEIEPDVSLGRWGEIKLTAECDCVQERIDEAKEEGDEAGYSRGYDEGVEDGRAEAKSS